jgi:hypothetical protein
MRVFCFLAESTLEFVVLGLFISGVIYWAMIARAFMMG